MGQDDDEPCAIQHGFAGGEINSKSDAAFKGMDQWARFASCRAAEFSYLVEDEVVA